MHRRIGRIACHTVQGTCYNVSRIGTYANAGPEGQKKKKKAIVLSHTTLYIVYVDITREIRY